MKTEESCRACTNNAALGLNDLLVCFYCNDGDLWESKEPNKQEEIIKPKTARTFTEEEVVELLEWIVRYSKSYHPIREPADERMRWSQRYTNTTLSYEQLIQKWLNSKTNLHA